MTPAESKSQQPELAVLHDVNDGRVRLVILASADRMKLFLRAALLQPRASVGAIDRSRLLALVPPSIPQRGFAGDVLDDLAASLGEGELSAPRRVAKGVEPTAGRAGKVVWLVRPHPRRGDRPATPEELWIRPNDIQIIEAFEKGKAVARLYPPGSGTDGYDVLGQRLPALQGAPVELELVGALRRETLEGKEWEQIVAEQPGFISLSGTRATLEVELRVDGDVDNKSGSIEFTGGVRVRGNIGADFIVRAAGTILVEGDVIGGSVTSKGADVIVRGAVVGVRADARTVGEHLGLRAVELAGRKVEHEVHAATSASLNTLRNCSVVAGGDIALQNESHHATIRTRGSLNLPRGHLIGGQAFVGGAVDASVIGTPKGARTRVSISGDVESTAEWGQVTDNLRSHESALETLRLYLGPFAESAQGLSKLDEAHRRRIDTLRRKLEEVSSSHAALLIEQQRLKARGAPVGTSFIVVRTMLHAGAEISAGDAKLVVDADIPGPVRMSFDASANAIAVERGGMQP